MPKATIPTLKSGKRKNIEYTTLKALTLALGYRIVFKKTHRAKAAAHYHSGKSGAEA